VLRGDREVAPPTNYSSSELAQIVVVQRNHFVGFPAATVSGLMCDTCMDRFCLRLTCRLLRDGRRDTASRRSSLLCPSVAVGAQYKAAHHGSQLFRLAVELLGGAGRLFRIGRVLLRDLVHLGYGCVDLLDAFSLLVRSRSNLGDTTFSVLDRLFDHVRGVLGGFGTALSQVAYLFGHNCKPLAGVTRPGGLDRGVQRQQIGLERYLVDSLHDLGRLV